jgi:hypothetical protein
MSYGTIACDTLNTSTGVLASQNGITGIAKAWVSFVGSTASINSSFNVSSITRSAAGKYTVNFTNSLPSSSYAPVITTSTDGSSTWIAAPQIYTTGGYSTVAPTTSSFVFGTLNNAYGAFVDPAYISIAVFSS